MEDIVSRMVQIGVVTDTDAQGRRVRVKFPDTGLTSDWLRVLQNPCAVTAGSEQEHTHGVTVAAWMPKVNDTVLVVYLPVFNSDGFVIGGI